MLVNFSAAIPHPLQGQGTLPQLQGWIKHIQGNNINLTALCNWFKSDHMIYFQPMRCKRKSAGRGKAVSLIVLDFCFLTKKRDKRKTAAPALLILTLFHPCWKTVQCLALLCSYINRRSKAKEITEEVILSSDTVEMSIKLTNFRGPISASLVTWLNKPLLLTTTFVVR